MACHSCSRTQAPGSPLSPASQRCQCHGGGLVIVRCIARDANRAHDRAGFRADQYTARHWHERASDGVHRGVDEMRPVQRHLVDGPRADAECDGAIGLALGDIGAAQLVPSSAAKAFSAPRAS